MSRLGQGARAGAGAAPFLPTCAEELRALGWEALDVILVSGDAYVDHPAFGAALIGRLLERAGYRVGILPQPDWRSSEPFKALGRPRLFFGVTSGAMDSMLCHYTANRRRRSDDGASPGGRAGMRPDRAAIVYANRCREAYREVPVILGGVEASLRRVAHYDYWSDSVRRGILLDAKAELLVYGQGERPILEIAERLARGEPCASLDDVAGTGFLSREPEALATKLGLGVVELPPFEEVSESRAAYARGSALLQRELTPGAGRSLLYQRHGARAVVMLPPARAPSVEELDAIYALPFSRAPHPRYRGQAIPAFEQLENSITLMRGCAGGCAFCAISAHQGREIVSRSTASVIDEVERVVASPRFRGTLSDLGGPTANLWGMGCSDPEAKASCARASCLYPSRCPRFGADHAPLIALYREARAVAGVRHLFVASGVRYDVALQDERSGERYLRELIQNHVSGQLKVAPEHVSKCVLAQMRKPPIEQFEALRGLFTKYSRAAGKEQYLVPYFISSHPGCGLEESEALRRYLMKNGWKPRQVQDFTPTPMTRATDIYYTGVAPESGVPVQVERSREGKLMQRALLGWADPNLAAPRAKAERALGERAHRGKRSAKR